MHRLDIRATLTLIIETPTGWYESSFTLSRVFWRSVSAHPWTRRKRQSKGKSSTLHYPSYSMRVDRDVDRFPCIFTMQDIPSVELGIFAPGFSCIWTPLLTTCCTGRIWCLPTWFNHTHALVCPCWRVQDLSRALEHEETDAHEGVASSLSCSGVGTYPLSSSSSFAGPSRSISTRKPLTCSWFTSSMAHAKWRPSMNSSVKLLPACPNWGSHKSTHEATVSLLPNSVVLVLGSTAFRPWRFLAFLCPRQVTLPWNARHQWWCYR